MLCMTTCLVLVAAATSGGAVAPRAPGSADAEVAPGGAAQTRSGPATLHARDAVAVDVVRLYDVGAADKSVVMAYEPRGLVSGDVPSSSWSALLAWALEPSGFVARERDGVVLIAPKGWPQPTRRLVAPRGAPVGTNRLVGEGVEARVALEELAKRAGFKGIASDKDVVTGALTLDIRGGNWGAALAAALEALCLEGRRAADGVLHVEPGCPGQTREGLTPVPAAAGDPETANDWQLATQRIALADLRCSAILAVDGAPRFAVLAAPSLRFIVRPGTLVGAQLGTVDEVRADGLVITEEVRDARGKRIPVVTTLPLTPLKR